MRNIAPDQSGCIVTDEVHDPISNKLCRGARHRQRGHHNWARRYAPFHFPESTHHETAHRGSVHIGPQSSLFLNGVTPLSGILHQFEGGVMLPN